MARVGNNWIKALGGYLKTASVSGLHILINGTDRYLNFNLTSGVTGYGLRDNAGVMEFKDDGGSWVPFTSGGGGLTTEQVQDIVGALIIGGNGITATYNDIAATLTIDISTTELGKLNNISVTQAVDLDQMELDIAALSAAVVLKGTWDASVGTFPAGDSAGWSYIVSVGGTVDGVEFTANDRIVAIVDSASTTVYAGNWHKLDYTDAVLSVDGEVGAVLLADILNNKLEKTTVVDDDTFITMDSEDSDIIKRLTWANIKTALTTVFNALFASKATETYAGNVLSTGLLKGGVITINAGNTTVDISAGNGYVVDNTTDPDNPSIVPISWNAIVGLVLTNIGTTDTTYISMDVNGLPVQKSTTHTASENRDEVVLGGASHFDNVNVTLVFETPVPAYNAIQLLRDLAMAIGPLKLSGGVYSANGANLNINRTSGLGFAFGESFSLTPKDPNGIAIPSASALSFLRSFNDGAGASDVSDGLVTAIDPDQYDDGSGTRQAVSNNKWTIQPILMFPSSLVTVINYGQLEYNNLDDALSNITTPITTFPEQESAILMGHLLVKKGATVLNSETVAVFKGAGKFESIGGSAGTNVATLDGTYLNSSIPQFLINLVNGALTVRSGTGDDDDVIMAWQDNAGVERVSINGAGVLKAKIFGVGAEFDNGNSGTTKTIDWGNGNFQKITMTGNCVFTFTAPPAIGRYQLKFIQDVTGGRTATHPTILTAAGAGVTLSTGAGEVDVVTYYWDGISYHVVDTLDFS